MADSSFITIDSDYLLKLCTIYDALNKQLLAMGADDARVSFHEHLGSTIGKLNEGMVLADGNSHLEALRTIEARVSLTTFCLDTFASSLQADGKDELADSLRMLTGLARKDYQSMSHLSIVLMKDKVDHTICLRTEQIGRLSARIEELRSENLEVQMRLRQLQEENATYLNRIVQHSKSLAVDSPAKLGDTRLLSYSSGLELPPDKKLSQLQVEDLIDEIYETKLKQEEAAGRSQPLAMYIGKFFAYKFGVEALACFNHRLFNDALEEYSQQTRSSWIHTFLSIRNMECEESYVEEQRRIEMRLRTVVRRCLLEHQPDISEGEMARVMQSKPYDFYTNNNMKLEERSVQAILGIVYSQEEAVEVRALLEEYMWSEKKRKLGGSVVSQMQQSPSKSSYKFRPPQPTSTPSPRSKGSPAGVQTVSLTYKRLLNTILNLELQKHLEKLRRTTLLFREYDELTEGILSFSRLLDLLNSLRLQADDNILLSLSQFVQETRPIRKQPTQEDLYQLMLEGEHNLQITYSRFVEFARKKLPRGGRTLLDVVNVR